MRTNGGSGAIGDGLIHAAWRLAHAVCVVAVASFCLALAPSALATSFTWAGAAEAGSEEWSEGLNWAGGIAPKAGKKIETLSFPRLTGRACELEAASHSCYLSYDDTVGLDTESMRIDDGDEYAVGGEALTLGKGGLTASPETGSSEPALDLVELPLELSEAQKWSVSGRGTGEDLSGLWLEGAVTGSDSLTVELGKMPVLYLVNETEVGPVKIVGTDSSRSGSENGVVGFLDEMNSEDGEPVELSHVAFFGSGELGPLTTKDAELDVGTGLEPAGDIEAPSITLDSGTSIAFEITGDEGFPFFDYSQLASEGTIDLGGATIGVDVGPPSKGKTCPELVPGQTFTFVSTTGALSGAFANAPEHGPDIPITFAAGCEAASQVMRISYNKGGGGNETVTATVEAKPVVTESPASATVTEGNSATFKAAATGATSVQWQVKKGAGAFESDTSDSGAATETLTVEHTTREQSGDEYRAVFKNGAGEVSTTAATLTVEALAGSGGSGGSAPTSSTSPGGGGSSGVLGVTKVRASAAQLKTLLADLLVPQGRNAKIEALLAHGGYVASFNALSGGQIASSWYLVPKGGHLATAKPTLVARGSVSFTAAGAEKLAIKLTANGSKLLKHAKELKLTAQGTITQSGEGAIGATESFVVRR